MIPLRDIAPRLSGRVDRAYTVPVGYLIGFTINLSLLFLSVGYHMMMMIAIAQKDPALGYSAQTRSNGSIVVFGFKPSASMFSYCDSNRLKLRSEVIKVVTQPVTILRPEATA